MFKKILLNTARLFFLSSYLCCAGLSRIFEAVELCCYDACLSLNIFKKQDFSFESKFSKEEIDTMAIQTVDSMTLKEIQDKFQVSYRQARHIKNASPLTITQYGQMA